MKLPIHDFKGLDDWFVAFVGGEQTDSAGNTRTWTDKDLDQIVANLNARAGKNLYSGAPFVIGHPKTDDPAWGWTEAAKRVGNVIYTKGAKIHEAFAKGVKDGLWPNRSVRIGKDQHGYYLRHIGFLGAAAPAVDGMDPVYSQYNLDMEATEGDVFDFEADTYTPNALARMMRRMRDFIIDRFSVEDADRVIPDWDIDSLVGHAQHLESAPDATDAAEPVRMYSNPQQSTNPGDNDMPDGAFTQADLDAARQAGEQAGRDAAQADFATQQTDLQTQLDQERNQRLSAEFGREVSALVGEHITPAQAVGMVEFMLTLPDGEGAGFEFSAGEGDNASTINKSPREWFRDHLKSLKCPVDLREHGDDVGHVDTSNPDALAAAAIEYQHSQAAKGITISVTQAVNHVKQQHGGQ